MFANVGYEPQFSQVIDAPRGGIDAAEYLNACFGLQFLKYISYAFEETHTALLDDIMEPNCDQVHGSWCGLSGASVQSAVFARAHVHWNGLGRTTSTHADTLISGQESN